MNTATSNMFLPSPTTLKRYTTSLRHTRNFIAWKYKVPDMDISKLNYEFITGYEFWFKSIRNCNHNNTMKYQYGTKIN
ncbi:MAG: phage integrase SAM-like domain-containing protein [Ginsengibacter sp.]